MFIESSSVCAIRSVGESLASSFEGRIKCVSLNNQPCHARSTLVDINSDETLFYPFTVNVNKCGGSCNAIDNPYANSSIHAK